MSSTNRFDRERIIKWSTIVATAGTSVLAITALITVVLTINAWKATRESARPYLSLKESPSISENQGIQMEFKFYNVGIHPAAGLGSQTVIFGSKLDQQPVHFDQYNLVNEIPKDMSSSLVIQLGRDEVPVETIERNPFYVVVKLEYADPVSDHLYQQTLYYKWDGIKTGKLQSLVHVEVHEKEKILDYFKAHKIDDKLKIKIAP